MGYPAEDLAIARHARFQGGVVSRAQILRTGLTPEAIKSRIRRGRLALVLPGVYALPGTDASVEQKLWAGHLWLGDDSAVSHSAAAAIWGFNGFSKHPIELSTMRWKRAKDIRFPDGTSLVLHRVDNHLRSEIVELQRLPVTSVRRTLLDICGKKDRRAGGLLDEGIRKDLLALPDAWLYLEQEWMRGRRGVRILRTLLAERTPGLAPTDSGLEARLARAIVRAGLPAPAHQHPVRIPQATVHLDLAFPEAMLGIEVDSYSWHLDKQAFERDRERDNELSILGWTVLRVTWVMIRYQLEHVLDLIRHHLTSSVHLGAL